jgi:CHAD domain-containing protein
MSNADFAQQPYRQAMQHLIGERWQAVWEKVPVAIAGEDIEGVHDVRVASRRLRAAMDVAGDAFPRPWFKQLHKLAKEITTALGEVRDRDVLLAELAERRASATRGEQPAFDLIEGRLRAERDAMRETMNAFLQRLLDEGMPAETARRFGKKTR